MNRREVNAVTIQFEDFKNSSQLNNIGDCVEVPMAGPYTSARFAISRRERHLIDPGKIVLTAKMVTSHRGYEINPVDETVKHCGRVVAHVTHDEVCGLFYVSCDVDAPYGCGESMGDAVDEWLKVTA